ncbi:hypothetical protein GCM10007216_18330 [Thalassobacillus devorans]|uniref:Initiator Rep protein domain-containing protein n=1 Tax=Thalassobacillus devorans TaxID=279813 RepID=A0ABQ1P2Z6_9BACI|nr:hypothetical protein [Thalassobacillus devorans]NIK28223.1 hypothetical protein [Thalassobacillus devorans]GGC87917.1 hypothetical protein GCM10007216_18330 [Thalassobacillus devorans]
MKFNIHTPKLNRELLRDFSLGELELSKTAINLIIRLTPYIDRDGHIHLDREAIRKQMFCENRSFEKALKELCETDYKGKKLLICKDGHFISNFHLSTNGRESYLRNFPFLNTYKFLNLSTNQTRLFLYIATLNVHNDWKRVAVENLYKNKLHDRKYGMPVYDDYKTMYKDLFHLSDEGLISLRLPEEKGKIDSRDPNYKKLFHEMCGFRNNKKRRTSKYYKSKHAIGLKVNEDIYNQPAVSNQAGTEEIRLLSNRYHMFHEDLKEETFNFIIGQKNTMMELFSLSGLHIYRASLEKYFAEKHENIIYYNLKNKAANHFTDFYLLEEVKKVILGALKSDIGSRGAMAATGYPMSKTDIPMLVQFFIANSSDEHKVIIDQDIQKIEKAHELMTGLGAEEPWSDLQESIDVVYTKHIPKIQGMFIGNCRENGVKDPASLLSKINHKELVVSLAKKSLLSKEKKNDEEAEKLKQIVLFFKKKQVPVSPKIEPAPLTQREDRKAADTSNLFKKWLEQ